MRLLIGRAPTCGNRQYSLVRKSACEAQEDHAGNVLEPFRRIPQGEYREPGYSDGAAKISGAGALRINFGLSLVRTCHARSLLRSACSSRDETDDAGEVFGASALMPALGPSQKRPAHDRRNHFGLGVGVGIHIVKALMQQRSLGVFV